MASVNKVILIGNLGDDPDFRSTGTGQSVATLRMATNERWTDKNGQQQERAEWHRVVVWGKQAEHCKEYLSKGRQVYVEGRLQTREWTDKEGHKRYTTEVVAQRVQFLGGPGERRAGDGNAARKPANDLVAGGMPPPQPGASAEPSGGFSSEEEDIPF